MASIARKSSPRLPQLEKAHAQQQRPNAAKNKLINFKKSLKTNPWLLKLANIPDNSYKNSLLILWFSFSPWVLASRNCFYVCICVCLYIHKLIYKYIQVGICCFVFPGDTEGFSGCLIQHVARNGSLLVYFTCLFFLTLWFLLTSNFSLSRALTLHGPC